jgi:RNA polymerase sigma-70 factor (ECF subfamily)
MDPESSIDLIRLAQAGDAEAMNRLFSRHLPELRRWARGRLPASARDMSDTHDLVQEAMKRTVLNFNRFEYRGEGALRAYLHAAVVNLVHDHVRRVGRRPIQTELADDLSADDESPLDRAILGQTFERFESAIAQLDPIDQHAVRARLELGCSYAEIATLTGRPTADAARVAVARAVKKVAQIMAAAHRRQQSD